MFKYFNSRIELTKEEHRKRDLGYFKYVLFSCLILFVPLTFFLAAIMFYTKSLCFCYLIALLFNTKSIVKNKGIESLKHFTFINYFKCIIKKIMKKNGNKISLIKNITIKSKVHSLRIQNNLIETYYFENKIHNESGEFAIITNNEMNKYGVSTITGINYFNGVYFSPDIVSVKELIIQRDLSNKLTNF